MTEREKVIKGLEFTKAMITFNPLSGEDIEPGNLNEADKTSYDACVGAIALLKEQEAVKPIHKCWNGRFTQLNRINGYSFCPYCGKPIDWGKNVLL